MNYQIGPWQFIENRCVLVSEGIERELDPLLAKLLIYFATRSQQIIPRQELVEQVWKQSFVDDNAINRAISELRKQLAHPVHKAPLIKTHYRKGYSLTVVAQKMVEPEAVIPPSTPTAKIEEQSSVPVATTQTPVVADKARLITKKRVLISISAIVATILVYWLSTVTTVEIKNGQSKNVTATLIPSTWNVGAEAHPELSSDRQFLAYSNINPDDGSIRAFVKRIADQREVELTYPGFQVAVHSWQLNQRKVLLQATNLAKQQCKLLLADLTNFPDVGQIHTLKTCDLRYTGFAQLDETGEFIYYADSKAQSNGAGLFRYNVKQQKESILVPPSDIKFGVNMPRLSPSGKQIAYVLNQQSQPFSIYVYNLDSRETKRVFQGKNKTISFAFDWLAEDNALQISEESELTTIYLSGTEITKIDRFNITPAISPFYLAAYSTNSVFFSPGQTQQLSLLKVSELFTDNPQTEQLFASQSDNYNAVEFTNEQGKGQIFVSNRSGSAQLWGYINGREQQLSEFEYTQNNKSRIALLRLASNGKFILLKYNNQLVFFDISSQRVHNLPELKEFNIASYTWGDNSESIYFIEQQAQSLHLWEFSLLTRELKKYENIQPNALLAAPDGQAYAVTEDELIRLADRKHWSIPQSLTAELFHAVNQDYLYFNDGISQVSRMNLVTNEVESTHVDFHPLVFSVNEQNELLFSKREYKSTQIMQVTWE